MSSPSRASRIPHSTSGRFVPLLSLLLIAGMIAGCVGPATPTSGTHTPGTGTPTPRRPTAETGGLTYVRSASYATMTGGTPSMASLRYTLSQGQETPSQAQQNTLAQTTALTAAEVEVLLKRLPELTGQKEDQVEFKLPPQTLPAPRPGQTIQEPFPPEAQGPDVVQPVVGPLKVLRYSPEGNVDLAPFLSITFDQPMVPLTSHAELAAKEVPVKLTPQPEGEWRWVGTKTLVFQPAFRFPMATRYTVEIPAGTTSANGGKLAEEVTFSFATPAPVLVSYFPNDSPQRRDVLLFASFDQRIDPAAVLKTIRVSAAGRTFATRLATEAEIAANETAAQMAKNTVEGRWLAFRTTELLPYNSTITVDIGPGTPSAEGPLTTDAAQSFAFSTFGPLKITRVRCGWDNACQPLQPWYITFSNPLDEGAFDESLVTISPELSNGKLFVVDKTLRIEGQAKGRTTYHITLRAGIQDQYGQTLGEDQTVTIEVGSAEPTMYASRESMVVLDPSSRPAFSVFTINYNTIKVQAYAVQPEDWPAYMDYLEAARRSTTPTKVPGTKKIDQEMPVKGELDVLKETSIDLSPALGETHSRQALAGSTGHVVLIVQPGEPSVPPSERLNWKPTVSVWVQATSLGVDAFVDSKKLVVWASSLQDGSPVAGAKVTVYPGKATAETRSDGLVRFDQPTTSADRLGYLIARSGHDSVILPENIDWWAGGWRRTLDRDQARWYVIDDRSMYRPGEEVHLKGWIRQLHLEEGADILSLPRAGDTVTYQVNDSRGNEVAKGTAKLNALGGFDLAFVLPETMNLGDTSVQLSAGAGKAYHSFQVQEFRRPEFEVNTSVSEGPFLALEHAQFTVEAKYYAGGALPNAEVTWLVTSQESTYRPPNWDEFEFGVWVPWWRSFSRGMDFFPGGVDGEASSETYQGVTDATGKHTLRVDFEASDPPKPTSITAEGTVMDVNRQAWTGSSTILVHPAELYVGLRTNRTFYEKGQPITVDAIVVDLDGNAVVDRPIAIKLARLDWRYVKGEWVEEEADVQSCTVGSLKEPVSCKFEAREGGEYRLTAFIMDGKGRKNYSQMTRWVSGGKRPGAAKVEREEVELIPDRQEYQPGDVAEILVQSPFVPAEGLLTLRRGGILSTERFQMSGSTFTLRIPIDERYIPNLNVQVDLVGAAGRLNSAGEVDASLPKRPAFASGTLELSVPAYSRTLAVTATPRDRALEPGGETTLAVMVTNAAGKPVAGAELAVIVVDESVLALTGYKLLDPIAVFYQNREAGVTDYYLRQYIRLADPTALANMADGRAEMAFGARAPEAMPTMPMALFDSMAKEALPRGAPEPAPAIRVRSDFNPLATFAPSVPTDANGQATVTVKVPDNLTRYRVMVVAVAGEKEYGKAESAITARLPLMVRASPPRFLNFGDQFELPVVIQNQTDAPMTVDVVVQATNVTGLGSQGQRLTVPANDRREVRLPYVTESAGTARFQVGAVSGKWADASEFSLPVYTPATTEAFAVYGTVDQGAIAQPILAPGDVYQQFGGLDISTSSTALQALTDAVLYLVQYPYECSEQLASRILAVAALRDVLTAFKAKGLPAPEELVKAVNRDIELLVSLQNDDGGWPVWQKGRDSWPFYSIHATFALIKAKEKGFTVPEKTLSAAIQHLRDIERHYPSWYPEDLRNTLTSYALYVRAQYGDVDVARARRLVNEKGVTKLQSEALGWLWMVMKDNAASRSEVAAIRKHLDNTVVETAGAANFSTSYREEDGYLLLASDRRADGVLLEAFIANDPKSDLIPKLVKGLMAHRKRGQWSNTQENVFILLALDKYFARYEAQTPDFVARAWLGGDYVAEFKFSGRSTDYKAVQVPMSYLAKQDGQQNLVLSKEGAGRLYYRLGLTYAPKDLTLEPLDQGFTVLRTYEAVDDPADVRQDEDGTWHVRAGARVRIKLTMVAPSRRYHVALTDPLPAGFEAMNPALAVTGSIPQAPQDTTSPRMRYWWWHWTWYEHQNLRDQRAEAFASLLWEGVHSYTYVARATTPGKFVVPPPKAEEMYSPEVFGRGATERMIIE
ncbi:MAG TPA: alpha-2-macroglobulin family protein [Anaerolineae bacterium]|nr:alpha-2-macroglobulin family protein [Anaerolineae bacterium]